MMDPNYNRSSLSLDHAEATKTCLIGQDPTFLPVAIAIQAEVAPIPGTLFSPAGRMMKPVEGHGQMYNSPCWICRADG